ncbi:hypothetical protein [Halomonas dongshanensis]|uniref:Uncharacterized protein n=1 Tax=Halomonas dongshanensis TaxID=2890835 RepID=A0ABT2EII4_9GAMM|nr:hypothetical protein [Halomonas dongshanensis]MCS2610414.1 hypothetical protein [Halomonas dongshanensis]
MATTNKVLRYFRCVSDNNPFDLESLISFCREQVGTVGESEWRQAGEVIRIQHYRQENHGVLLHFVRYVPGESSDTLTPGAESEEDNEEPYPAPQGMEYKDGDFFMYCCGHDVIGTAHGRSMHHSKITQYLKYYLQIGTTDNINPEGIEYSFKLSTALNLEKYRVIERHGVSRVEFSASAYNASYYEHGHHENWFRRYVLQATADAVKNRLGRYDDESQMTAMEDLIVEGTVKLKGNTRANDIAKSQLREIAEEAIEDDGIVIYTHDGEPLRSFDMRLQTKASVERYGKSVYYDSVWVKLKAYYRKLEGDRLLGQ